MPDATPKGPRPSDNNDKSFLTPASTIKKIWVVTTATVLLVMAALYFFILPHIKSVAAPTVRVETVKATDLNIYGEYVGQIRAQQFVEVHARVEGYLESMLFREGSYVEKGQTLFVIDPQVYKAHLNKAHALLNKARVQLNKTERDLERIKPLYEQNAASQLDLDNATAAYETAVADVVINQAELTQAELTLGYTQVKSPISGYISERMADIGTLVGPSAGKSLLATVFRTDSVRVDFSMTALDYLKSKDRNVNLANSDSTHKWDSYITITLADGSVYPHKGIIDFTDPKVDPSKGTFSVRAKMANPDHSLLPGEFTTVRVLLDVREDIVQIPTDAIVEGEDGPYVFVVGDDNIVEQRMIRTGTEIGEMTIVESGLDKGETIIVDGVDNSLSDGMKVNPVPVPSDEVSIPVTEQVLAVPADTLKSNDPK